MSSTTALLTIAAKNYVPRVRVLARSLARHHPELRLHLVLTDSLQDCFDPAAEPYELIELSQLPIPGLSRLCFGLSRMALAVVAKPYALQHLLDCDHGSALFVDPDTMVLGDLGGLLDQVRAHAVVTVPHLTASLREGQGGIERELNILKCGVRNGGLIGVSESDCARAFLNWWQRRLRRHCEHDLRRGVYYDQRWLDLASTLFDDVHLVRDAGSSVGYWNLPERSSELAHWRWRLVHFSGFDPADPRQVTHHSPRLATSELSPATAALLDCYAQELMAAGQVQAASWPYAFDRFDNGVPVPAVARRAYAAHPQLADRFSNPLCSGGSKCLYHWLTKPIDRRQPPIPRVWELVYAERADVRDAFPDLRGADRNEFVNWIRVSGRAECEVDERMG